MDISSDQKLIADNIPFFSISLYTLHISFIIIIISSTCFTIASNMMCIKHNADVIISGNWFLAHLRQCILHSEMLPVTNVGSHRHIDVSRASISLCIRFYMGVIILYIVIIIIIGTKTLYINFCLFKQIPMVSKGF